MRLQFAEHLATDLARAWALLADPAAMNTWSTARIAALSPGDASHPAGIGALRRVHLPHRFGVLTEVIEDAAADRLVYRVIAGAPVKSHRGVLAFAPDARGTHVTWTVDIEPVASVLAPVMRAFLAREMTASIRRLVDVARADTAAPLAPPPARPDLDADAPLAALVAGGRTIAGAQLALADRLDAADDPRAHFARVYHFVTTGLVDAAVAGHFTHPAWVLRLVPIFDAYFTTAVHATAPEPHWRRAFAHLERSRHLPRFELAMHAVFVGMRAHIEDDLPRTLARVYAAHYAGRCDHVRFRADYLHMRHVFTAAGERIMAHYPRATWTPRARLVDALTPHALRDGVIDRHFYPITRERRRAFERGGMLGELLASASRDLGQ